MMSRYTAVAVQTIIRHVREPDWRDAIVRENVNRSLSLMDYVSHRWGSAKLYVLPEFSLTGVEQVRSVEEWTRTPVRERAGRQSRRSGVFRRKSYSFRPLKTARLPVDQMRAGKKDT